MSKMHVVPVLSKEEIEAHIVHDERRIRRCEAVLAAIREGRRRPLIVDMHGIADRKVRQDFEFEIRLYQERLEGLRQQLARLDPDGSDE